MAAPSRPAWRWSWTGSVSLGYYNMDQVVAQALTFQEKNGLTTMDRTPKADPAAIATATRGKRNPSAMDVNPCLD